MNKLYCRMGTTADLSALKKLYRAGFPEDDEVYIEHFLEAIEPASMVCCGVLDGEIVCALYLLPAKAVRGNDSLSVRYLYAGATHPTRRGKGYYSTLLDFAAEQGRAAGEAAIYLRPASTDLYRYYARLGYHSGISVRAPGSGYHFTPCAPFDKLLADNTPKSDDKGCVILPLSGTLSPCWWEGSTTLLIGE